MRGLLVRATLGAVAALLMTGTSALPPSATCMSCHDKGTGPMILRHASHPYDVDYRQAQSRKRDTLRPAEAASGFGGTVESDLLIEGMVTCVSCHVDHDEETAEVFRLRIATTYTDMCRACHAIDGR
jgi:hypothetical protein